MLTGCLSAASSCAAASVCVCAARCCSVLVVGLFLWSAATAATALPCLTGLAGAVPAAAASGAQLALLLLLGARGLMGLASAAAMPCVTSISAQLVPASERGSAVSFVYACFNAGGAAWLPGAAAGRCLCVLSLYAVYRRRQADQLE